MKIFIICSKAFYGLIPPIKEKLEASNHIVYLPNCYENPDTESLYRGTKDHGKWKGKMMKHSEEVIKEVDAVLVLNYTKNNIPNYIGGATFLEMYDAFRLGKTIYMMNEIPDLLLKDEIIGFNPIIINGNLDKIKSLSKRLIK